MSKKKKAKEANDRQVTHVKWVPKAGAWCRTTISGGTQKQEWLTQKP